MFPAFGQGRHHCGGDEAGEEEGEAKEDTEKHRSKEAHEAPVGGGETLIRRVHCQAEHIADGVMLAGCGRRGRGAP